MRIHAYCRISNADQSIRSQETAILSFLPAGAEIKMWSDTAGGTTSPLARPGIAAMLQACKRGDLVIVWKLDRLGRYLSTMLRAVETLETMGVVFSSVTERLDGTTPAGRLMVNLMACLAQYERELIHERTKAGIDARKAQGLRLGRPAKLNPTQIVHIRQALREGQPVSNLGRLFGVSHNTVRRVQLRIGPYAGSELDHDDEPLPLFPTLQPVSAIGATPDEPA